ncbi:hypothetical protein L6452_42393 [Arctium lappa]|uniref:Uncharacterized protein n=1 Tax=Arctium lappa TaxID=4217 RepID=A0ACB8XI51_ARCLA|nr:hypothetical protein L6452_42393 [Arctium lappa]
MEGPSAATAWNNCLNSSSSVAGCRFQEEDSSLLELQVEEEDDCQEWDSEEDGDESSIPSEWSEGEQLEEDGFEVEESVFENTSNRQGGFKGGDEGEGGTGVEEKDSTSGIGNLDLLEKGTEPEGQSNTKEESPEPPKDGRKDEGSGKLAKKGAEPIPKRGVVISETIGT